MMNTERLLEATELVVVNCAVADGWQLHEREPAKTTKSLYLHFRRADSGRSLTVRVSDHPSPVTQLASIEVDQPIKGLLNTLERLRRGTRLAQLAARIGNDGVAV